MASIDLHFHSCFSEGSLTPAELVSQGASQGLSVMALTDHNTIAGVPDFLAAAESHGIQAITGVELYVEHHSQPLHLLGYNFEVNNKKLQALFDALRTDNARRLERSVRALQRHGFVLDGAHIHDLPSDNFGAIHVLQEMERHPENIEKMKRELGDAIDDFFIKINHYFGSDAPGSFQLSEIPAAQAIETIHAAGGFTALAHPGQQLSYEADDVIIELHDVGLDALEVLSPYHSWHQIEHYQHLALQRELLITGGSDFHGTIEQGCEAPISRQWDYFRVPDTLYQRLTKRFTTLP